MFDLQGQGALVLGGTSGLGYACAEALQAAGAQVTIASRSAERVRDAAQALGCAGRTLDATSEAEVERFFAGTPAWGHIVVSIGPGRAGAVKGMSMAQARAAMDAKFWSAYQVARCARLLPEGSLTIVTGQVGRRPQPQMVLLGAINAGLEGLVRGLALELAPVRVNAVAPGLVDTPLHAAMPAQDRQALFDAVAARLPVRRMGQAVDVAQAVLYLACNRFSTGSTLRVDGGSTVA